MRESLKKRLDALPVMVLTDEELAEIEAVAEAAEAGGYVSSGEVLAGILERARAEHDRVGGVLIRTVDAQTRTLGSASEMCLDKPA